MNNQTLSQRQGVSLSRANIIVYINVIYIFALQDIQYNSITQYNSKILYKNICLEPGFITLRGTHDLYFKLMKVLGISLSCLLHDDFYSCIFLYSCMLRGRRRYFFLPEHKP